MFIDHTVDSAPPAARRTMAATGKRLGRIPPAVARMAESPELLDGFLKSSALFEASTLDPIAREVVVMTMATRNHCHVCVAMHTGKLKALNAGPDVVAALTDQSPLPDRGLEAIRTFTLEVLRTAGEVDDDTLTAFLEAGYTHRNALEVVLGIGAYTMSTLANRMTAAPA
ncbi:carboxymuconolactone decarboxylase family protein [Umezawaea endophytica]|uniref:Carboxymuconolactone decarboxylase family protein n=1 Tax=Umezawaea endophytica TaxID=1654476 RepID=A0A9X2VMG4_9PSEU|nr:carboxymuconolactone decarboxylase family protein [Umezawaea endophytica]MCS7479305.1 carboxymuconolactone decarboxylase family protein [Umezawaea endophytica]